MIDNNIDGDELSYKPSRFALYPETFPYPIFEEDEARALIAEIKNICKIKKIPLLFASYEKDHIELCFFNTVSSKKALQNIAKFENLKFSLMVAAKSPKIEFLATYQGHRSSDEHILLSELRRNNDGVDTSNWKIKFVNSNVYFRVDALSARTISNRVLKTDTGKVSMKFQRIVYSSRAFKLTPL